MSLHPGRTKVGLNSCIWTYPGLQTTVRTVGSLEYWHCTNGLNRVLLLVFANLLQPGLTILILSYKLYV